MPLKLTGKTITDPLYGNVHLTELESKIVSTRVFQRLHNVRQLGLGHLVFPSAGYSRFAHSVGACFNADRMMTAIEANQSRKTFSDDERQAFRIAALLHDLGHFPFSHTTEHAAKRFYRDGLYKVNVEGQQESLPLQDEHEAPAFIDHEDTGGLIFQDDPEINAIFDSGSYISKEEITATFLDENLYTMISSDLDCDRLDYLKRTSLHSGAPYGAVDVDFIISKSTVDVNGRFCLGRKATRATDHLLVSRFYDFMQIPYQKTVASLEWSLEESVIALLGRGLIKLSEADITKMLQSGIWPDFDDGALVARMRELLISGEADEVTNDHLRAVLHRNPAKLVYAWECLVEMASTEQEAREDLLKLKIEKVASSLGIDERRFHTWKAPFKLAKAGPILQGSPKGRDYSDEEQQQLVHILHDDRVPSVPLVDLTNCISHHMAKLRYRVLRVYYLPSETDKDDIKKSLREAFKDA